MDQDGLCGLGKWPRVKINRVGNLAERDYSVESVAETLRKVVEHAPGLDIKIHCGDDYEKDNCVATVICKDGKVEVVAPEIGVIPDIPEEQMKSNLYSNLFGM